MSGCEEVREILVAVARGENVSAAGQTFLREHASGCAACQRHLSNQRALSSGLAAVASNSTGAPPPAVKTALMTEFRRQRKVTPMRRPVVRWSLATAIAAALLVALFLANTQRPGLTPLRPVDVPVAKAPVPSSVPVAATPPNATQRRDMARESAVNASVRVPRRHRVATPVKVLEEARKAPAPEVATDFFEIPYAEPLRPEERADVFRIQMPRANMAVFGLPVTGGRLDSRVTADVLMGEDGVARAIRFIR